MPRVPRDKESTTPKKRTRKAASNGENGIHAENGNGAVQSAVNVSPEPAKGVHVSPSLEEQIRERAYQLYMQRGGNGGSPEQDWLQAKEEVCGRQDFA